MNIKSYIAKIIPLIIIGLSIIITLVLALLKSDEEKDDISVDVPNVKPLLVESVDFRIYVESAGHIKPKTIYPLRLDLSGKVVFLSTYFNDNRIFNKGDTLLRIDSTDYSIARKFLAIKGSQIYHLYNNKHELTFMHIHNNKTEKIEHKTN